MSKINAVLLGLALTIPGVIAGCEQSAVSTMNGIEIVSIDLKDWENPEDGKTYLVAMPTWKNSGDAAVRQVAFVAEVEGLPNSEQPSAEQKEPQFYGAIVEPGTTVTPNKVPQEGVILGEKSKLEKIKPQDVHLMAFASNKDFVPPVTGGAK